MCAFQDSTRKKVLWSLFVHCLWINMWIIECNSCLRICPCCGCQAEYVQRFPERSLTADRRIKIKHMVTSVVHSHKHWLKVLFEHKRCVQLSVSGQASSLPLLVVSGFTQGQQWRMQMWLRDEWWVFLCFSKKGNFFPLI